MIIKKFQASSFPEAMKLIKKQLGPDAIILSSEQTTTGVEVVAALERDDPGPVSNNVDELKQEILALKEVLRQMRAAGYEFSVPEQKRRLLQLLRKNAFKDEFALRLCEQARDLEEMIKVISSELKTGLPEGRAKAVIVLGPTGVGKTTTLMKLVAKAVRHGSTVGVVGLDTHKIGALHYLKRFCSVLGLPFKAVHTVEALPEAVLNMADRDRVFIDTPGRNPFDRTYLRSLERIFEEFTEIEAYLLLSAHYDERFITETYWFYRDLPVDCLGITKVDETPTKGMIYNISALYQKPIGFITNGQRIPKDIVFPCSRDLALMCLGAVQVKGGAHETWA